MTETSTWLTWYLWVSPTVLIAIGYCLGLPGRRSFLHVHTWSKWAHFQDIDTYPAHGPSSRPVRGDSIYARKCTTCNLPQTKRIRKF